MDHLISETRRMAIEVDELEKETIATQSELMMEKMNLDSADKSLSSCRKENELLKEILTSTKNNDTTISLFGKSIKSAVMMLFFLKKFIERTEPSKEQQEIKTNDLQAHYEEMLRRYETNSTYKAILEAEKYERELSELVVERQTTLMRLQTENFECFTV